MATNSCCAKCGNEGGASLKICKACTSVKYCNAMCQKNHWSKHKKVCKQRAAELRDEALFKDPPPKEDCEICFLPMPTKLITCMSLPPATILSVPIYDFAMDNAGLADKDIQFYYPCCGKNICKGCWYSKGKSGNNDKFKCPFCNSKGSKTDEEQFEKLTKRVEANDPDSMHVLAHYYYHGLGGMQQNCEKALELLTRSADLGCSKAHNNMGLHYYDGGDMKKAKFHYEAAAMAGHVLARNNVGIIEAKSGNMERAVKNWRIAAAGGEFYAMHSLQMMFEDGLVNRETIDSTLTAYNNSCSEMRSEARDSFIRSQSNTN